MMERDAIAGTARWTAARARESARPDRLFDDPLARTLAGEEGFALFDAEASEAISARLGRAAPLRPLRVVNRRVR